MYFEDQENRNKTGGCIEVVCGSMFSGKTEELIRRLKRAVIARQKIEVFKPLIDIRYHKENVVSHNQNSLESIPVETAQQILLYVNAETQVVGVDEAQFFDTDLASVCNQLANRGIRVIVAGLDMDYLGKPFGPMPELMAIAESVTKVHAICSHCGNLASYSHRSIENDKLVVLGEMESYEPLCRPCFLQAREKSSL